MSIEADGWSTRNSPTFTPASSSRTVSEAGTIKLDDDASLYRVGYHSEETKVHIMANDGFMLCDDDQCWDTTIDALRQYAHIDERKLLKCWKTHLGSRCVLRLQRPPELSKHVFEYIDGGWFPMFYTEANGFDIPKYIRVRQCAAYYGVMGLVDWIDAENHRQVVSKVFDKYINAPDMDLYHESWDINRSGFSFQADASLSFGQDHPGSTPRVFACLSIWEPELLRADRGRERVSHVGQRIKWVPDSNLKSFVPSSRVRETACSRHIRVEKEVKEVKPPESWRDR